MNDDTLIVTETEGDTFDLQLSESSTPETFRRRAASLTGSGLSESEARHVVATTPVPMEIFCDSERGIFAVEAEPLAYSPLSRRQHNSCKYIFYLINYSMFKKKLTDIILYKRICKYSVG